MDIVKMLIPPVWAAQYVVMPILCIFIGILYAALERSKNLDLNGRLSSFQVALGRSRPVGWDRFWGTMALVSVSSVILMNFLVWLGLTIRGV